MTTTITTWPTALLPALRTLWQCTLFPGQSPIAQRPRPASLALVFFLPALLLYPCLSFHLLEPDEGRYAEIPREMLVRGDWVVPHLQSQPYLDKPPLMYWLVAMSYQVFGVSAASARLVPAVAVHGCILLCYLFGCRFLGERQALRGAVLLTIMPGLAGIGRILTLDALLTLWITLGQLSGFAYLRDRVRGYGWLCAAACGLGVLTKGPVALILVLAPLLFWSWLYSARAERPSLRAWIAFAAVVLAINLPWYVMISLRHPGFLKYFFWQHNLERFLTPFDHLEPVWYYAPILLGGLLPATFWLWPAVRSLCDGDTVSASRRSPELAYFLICGLGCVLFFSMSGCKLPTYILPAFAPLALALGVLLDNGARLFSRRQSAVIGTWLVLTMLTNFIVLPVYAKERSPMRDEAVMHAACADPNVAVVCYPRNCDSVGFYLERADLKSTRSKFVHLLIADLLTRPRTIVLFTHRHSIEAIKPALPPELRLTPIANFRRTDGNWLSKIIGDTPWGLCDIAVIERVGG